MFYHRLSKLRFIGYMVLGFSSIGLLILTDLTPNIIAIISFLLTAAICILYIYLKKGIRVAKIFLLIFLPYSILFSILCYFDFFKSIPNPWSVILVVTIISFVNVGIIFAIVKWGLVTAKDLFKYD